MITKCAYDLFDKIAKNKSQVKAENRAKQKAIQTAHAERKAAEKMSRAAARNNSSIATPKPITPALAATPTPNTTALDTIPTAKPASGTNYREMFNKALKSKYTRYGAGAVGAAGLAYGGKKLYDHFAD